ncbi:MAG: hypothetical protein HKM95_17900 [Inquilinus sp.]|nr:hypothetical protein [Inquilinus sp.]
MSMNAVRRTSGLAGIFTAVALILAAVPAEARSDASRSFTLAARQWLLIERMTNSALLAALEIDVSPRLSAIHWSRDRFDRTQSELRDGDPLLGISPTTRPEIIGALNRVDARWQRYDSIFREIAASETISARQIRALTESHAETTEALAEMVDAYEHFVNGGYNHTILSTTIDGVEQLRAQTQLLLRALLTAAYHEDAASERQHLARSTQDFGRMLGGLIYGDPDLRLMPAPTQGIKDELKRVERMWLETQPILESAAVGDAVSESEIATVAQHANEMALPLTMALLMYLTL